MKQIYTSFITVLFLVGMAFPQTVTPLKKKQFPLEVSFINHAVTMPFDGIVLNPLHPGFSLGTEFVYSEGRVGRIFQSLHLGYYHNKYNARAFFLETEAGYRFTTGFGLFADLSLGLGYLHSFHPREIFEMNSRGEYEHVRDGGKGALIVMTSLGAGYDLSRKFGWPVSLFFRFQPYIQTPCNLETSILPQSWVHFGIRIQLW